jgi:hypothetical protein
LVDLLTRWRDGAIAPRDAFTDAKALWLSRAWPKPHERGYDAVAHEVRYLLADARDLGLTHEDIPALLEYLRTPRWRFSKGQDRFSAYLEGVDWEKREALQQGDDYYGPLSADAEDERHEITFSDPDERRLHRGIRLAPETVWAEVRAKLCAPSPRDHEFLVDLVEDLCTAMPTSSSTVWRRWPTSARRHTDCWRRPTSAASQARPPSASGACRSGSSVMGGP